MYIVQRGKKVAQMLADRQVNFNMVSKIKVSKEQKKIKNKTISQV